jgi:hypothetical protein
MENNFETIRTEKLNELLGRLERNKDLMSILLENVKTEYLEEAFDTFVKNLNNKELFVVEDALKLPARWLGSSAEHHTKPHSITLSNGKNMKTKYITKLTEEDIRQQRDIMAKIKQAAAVDVNTEAEEVHNRINALLDKLTPGDTLVFLTELFKNLSEKRENAINTLVRK